MYYVGAINRVGIEPLGDNDFYGQSYFVDPEGKFVGDVGDAYKPELIVRDLDLDMIKRSATAGRSTATAGPTPTTSWSSGEPMARTLIKNGTVVSADRRRSARRAVDGETIAAVVAPGSAAGDGHRGRSRRSTPPASTSIPGGIDVHTHMELPFGGTVRVRHVRDRHPRRGVGRRHDDRRLRRAAHRRAACRTALAAWHGKADGNCAIDYGFHQIIGGVDDESLKAMDYLVEHEGITSFKLFMAYPGVFYSDDGQILRAMQTAAENGAMIMMHAENGIAIDVLVAQALARGETDPKYHGFTRPSPLEGEATHRAIVLGHVAGNVPLYIVHMSAGEALEEVAAARHEGRNVFAETCPQYLYLTLEEHARPSPASRAPSGCARRRCARTHDTHHHQADLWKGLRMNELAVVSTDHCPFCMKDQKELGIGDFSKIPNGIGGVEHRMELIYQGVVTGEISARALGRDLLHDAGADVRPVPEEGRHRARQRRRHRRLGPERQDQDRHQRQAPHEHGPLGLGGLRRSTARSTPCCRRGTVVIENDSTSARKGHGQFVKRGLSQYLDLMAPSSSIPGPTGTIAERRRSGTTLVRSGDDDRGRRDEPNLALDRRQGRRRHLRPLGCRLQPGDGRAAGRGRPRVGRRGRRRGRRGRRRRSRRGGPRSLSRRAEVMFHLRELVDANRKEIASLLTAEHGKVLGDALGEVARGLENIEFACGIPHLLKGGYSEQAVDRRRRVLASASRSASSPASRRSTSRRWCRCGCSPTRSPAATRSCSSRARRTRRRRCSSPSCSKQAGLPDGCFNVVQGDKVAVDRILEHPDIAAVSFVGSTPIAKYIYETGTAQRQAGAGARRGQEPHARAARRRPRHGRRRRGRRRLRLGRRALHGDQRRARRRVASPTRWSAKIAERIPAIKVGPGSEPDNEMGPLITGEHRDKVAGYVDGAAGRGRHRRRRRPRRRARATASSSTRRCSTTSRPGMACYDDEIFGPVLGGRRGSAATTRALQLINDNPYGNGTAIFTRDGGAARQFQFDVQVGMVGVNVPIPVPVSYYSFGGWKASLFGDTHMYGPEGVNFYTRGQGRHEPLARPGHQHRSTSASRRTAEDRASGLRCRTADHAAVGAGRRPGQAGRGVRVQPRVDVRLATSCGRSRTSSTARSWPRRARSIVGPMVTNPATRDWTVTASRRSPRSTRCTATARSAASAAATRRCASPTASRPRWPRCARRSTSSASWPTAAASTTRARRSALPVGGRAAGSRSGSPATARRRCS